MTRVRAKARILERTTTAGNGPYALAAVDNSYNRFSSIMAVGDTTFASVIEPGVAFWTGLVTYSAANQITLTTVEESTGTFGSGTKEIMAGTLAAQSAFPDDVAGAIVTGGTSTAYTVGSYRVYDTLARMNGALIAFTPHTSNGATVTLSVDGLAAKPLRPSPGVELQSNVLIAGVPYAATYSNSDAVWYLHGLGGNTHGVPLGGLLDYTGSSVPSSAFVLPRGQALSRTTYGTYFALVGTTYGSGDGVNTFNVIDLSGRVTAMLETSASRLTSAVSGVDGGTLGATGGSQSHVLTTTEIPAHTHANSLSDPGHTHTNSTTGTSSTFQTSNTGGGVNVPNPGGGVINAAATGVTITNASAGSGAAHTIVQPTAIVLKLLRVL
jgi:microcystin-dependent protein